jgi:hypothetical protein
MLIGLSVASVKAQVLIGGNGATDEPHAGAILDLSKSTGQGLLLPKVDLQGPNVFTVAAAGEGATAGGMVVYNTAETWGNKGVYVWNGTTWSPVGEVAPACTGAPTVEALTAPTVCIGGNLSMTANVISDNGSPVTGYEWKLGETTIGTSASLSYAVQTADNGKALTLSVTNICGTTTTTGVTVNVPEAFVQTNPAAVSICNGTATTFTLAEPTGGSGAITYQWEQSSNNSTWTAIPDATEANYTTPALTANTYFHRIATAATCGGTITSASALVTVEGTAFTQANPIAVSICNGATTTFTVAAATGGTGALTYLWQQSSNGTTWSPATGTNTGVNYTTPALTTSMYYRRNAIRATCGGTINSTSAKVTVGTALSQGTPVSTTINYGATATFTMSAATGGSGTLTYQWQTTPYSTSGTWTDIVGATSASYTTQAMYCDAYFRRVATRECGGTKTSGAALVTVTPNPTSVTPVVMGDNTYATQCYGGTVGCWMVQNSMEGEAESNMGTGGKQYTVAQRAGACVSPWAVPTYAQAEELAAYLRNNATSDELCMWQRASQIRNWWTEYNNPCYLWVTDTDKGFGIAGMSCANVPHPVRCRLTE